MFEAERENLIENLIKKGYLSKPEVIFAFKKVKRHLFVPKKFEKEAYVDAPLPMGEGQTISAPHMVAIMTQALDVKKDSKILEVGTGSGYQAALLSEIAREGEVWTMERIPKLYEEAKKLLTKLNYQNIHIILAEKTLGYQKEAPYDRILVTAAASSIPQVLIDQLKEGGRMLIPVGYHFFQSLLQIDKKRGKIIKKNLGSCLFVPLIE